MDNQQLLMFAAIGLLAYWFFTNKSESFAGFPGAEQQVPHIHLTEEEAQMLSVSAPPPEEVPQFATAYTLQS